MRLNLQRYGAIIRYQLFLPPLFALSLFSVQFVQAEGYRTDSRTPYVHIITLYDRDENIVDFKDRFEALPYSPTVTCGKCHDIDAIRTGWHFNACDTTVDSGRPGEPWIYVDAATRTQLPLSYRQWPGTWNPQDVGLDEWAFTKRFGRHLPGGGPGEAAVLKAAEESGDSDTFEIPEDRWHIAGALEIDCMICHSADRSYNPADWAKHIERENFAWAPTASARLGIVKGTTEEVPQDYDPTFPELTDAEFPVTEYDRSRFDLEGLVFFDIVRKPSNERCYYCHTNHAVDELSAPRYQRDEDVHMAAGMNCTDCHRHGIDHQVVRGYEGEEGHSENVAAGTLTCASCHIGEHEPEDVLKGGGRLGAPIARHEGIPSIHFEKLECTVCHSGPWPQPRTLSVQTSMAHSLGISDEYRHPQDPPSIIEPVFRMQENGKIGIHRMLFPAFWGVIEQEQLTPLPIETAQKVVAGFLDGADAEEDPVESHPRGYRPITTEEIKSGLAALAGTLAQEQQATYVMAGQAYVLNGEELLAREHPTAAAYSWPIAHDVRGTGQSLSARECTDCHAADAPFFFGDIIAAGPDAEPVVRSMISLQGDFGPQFKATAAFFKFLIIGTLAMLLFHILADLIGNAIPRKNLDE